MQKKRLLLKAPGFSLRIGYFNSVFPDAIFVHCLRHPYDNFVSLMKQKKLAGPQWGIRIPQQLKLPNASTEAMAAQQLAVAYETIMKHIGRIENAASRYVPVRYVSFQTEFAPTVRRLFQACALEPPESILAHPEWFVVPNLKHRTPQETTDDKPALKILDQLSRQMGYDTTVSP
jgi:omega-hydroxy-beta-dihydromenaquinone-9 sulfotransferase